MGTTLEAAVDGFIASVGDDLAGLASADGDSARAVADARPDALDLVAAFIDADTVHTDAEVEAFRNLAASFGDARFAAANLDDVRRAGVLTGRRRRLTVTGPTFGVLVAADRADGGSRGWRYLKACTALGRAVAGLDLQTSAVELDALDRHRMLLRSELARAGVSSPVARAPDGGFFSTSPVGPTTPTTSTASAAGPVPARHATAGTTSTPTSPRVASTSAGERRDLDEVLEELESLIGLAPVKAEVELVTNLLAVQQLRAHRGLPTLPTSRHLVFTGNPGTGKTTVARLVAQIYASLGLLASGHLVETDRSGLVAGYVGQTAERTREVVTAALDGVLLIDEAYALTRSDDGRDFGREAVDTLVKLMEDHRDRLVVIVTGYPEEMADFVGSNPGLASRFPRTLRFPDYRDEELVAIATAIATSAGYHLEAGATAELEARLAGTRRDRGFGNGRLMRNLVEATVTRHATRVASLDEVSDTVLSALTAADLDAAWADVSH